MRIFYTRETKKKVGLSGGEDQAVKGRGADNNGNKTSKQSWLNWLVISTQNLLKSKLYFAHDIVICTILFYVVGQPSPVLLDGSHL